MPTSYTGLIGLALPATGELSGTWGDTVNDYITRYLDAAVAGAQTISGTQTAVTLSTANGTTLVSAGSGSTGSAQYAILNCTGNPAGTLTVTVPTASKVYLVVNATSTSQSVVVKPAGNTGVTVSAGRAALIAWNGTDFVTVATNDAARLSGVLPVTNGGTGATTSTGSGAVVLATSPTLTTPVIGTISNTGTLTLPTSTDTLVGRATTDTLTNKTLTTPVIGTISNTGTLTLPTSTDTLVGRATTDTLTNKTLTTPVINGFSGDTSVVNIGSGQIYKDVSGNVGIGTTAPAYKLDVVADSAAFGLNIRGRVADGISAVRFSNNSSTESARLVAFSDGTFTVSNTASPTERMRIDASGNVGVNTASPTEKLDVNGTVKATTFSGSAASLTGLPLTTGVTGTLPVANGGTGATTLTANNVVLGNGTSAVQFVAPSTAGNVLTSNGTSWASTALPTPAASPIPAGTAMLFAQTSAPTGWTKSTTHDNKALRVVNGTASSGGTVAFTSAFASQSVAGTVGNTTLTIAQMPAHTHTFNGSNTGGDTGFTGSGNLAPVASSSTGGGGSHTHSFTGTAINLAVQYVDVIIATKD